MTDSGENGEIGGKLFFLVINLFFDFPLSDEEYADWYPKQKVQSARKKLEGFNPAYVMRSVQIP